MLKIASAAVRKTMMIAIMVNVSCLFLSDSRIRTKKLILFGVRVRPASVSVEMTEPVLVKQLTPIRILKNSRR